MVFTLNPLRMRLSPTIKKNTPPNLTSPEEQLMYDEIITKPISKITSIVAII